MMIRFASVFIILWVTTNNQFSSRVEAFTTNRSFSVRRQHHRNSILLVVDTSTSLNDASSSAENDGDDIKVQEGGPADKFFTPKLIDGFKFNLFGIGRNDDEDKKNGAFQPPPNSLNDKVILITGASSGLGLESAKRLTLAGATVVLTARTTEKVTASINAVCEYCRDETTTGGSSSSNGLFGKTGRAVSGAFVNLNPDVRGVTLDLDDLSSARTFPERYLDCMKEDSDDDVVKKIDVLMNNAGGGGHPTRELTIDGYERTFQSNHLGHFLLTARLFEERLLNRDMNNNKENDNNNHGCTVISVSSVSHNCAIANHGKYEDESDIKYGYDFDNMNCEIEYTGEAYYQGKLANILFTKEIQRRANQHDLCWLKAVSLEPGGVTTDIWRHFLGYDPRTFQKRLDNGESLIQLKKSFWERLSTSLFYKIATQVERGANVQIWLAYAAATAATSDGTTTIQGGQHYDEFRNPIYVPQFADNEADSKRLWQLSEDMAGIEFDVSVLLATR